MSSVLDIPAVRDFALRLDIHQYRRLCDSGIIPEKTELLSGIVVAKMGKSPLHSWTVQFLADWFATLLDPTRILRIEQPLTLKDSEPEPDLAIIRGSRDDFRAEHPSSAELVIEVAISTEEIDVAKSSIYAAAAIPEYWLVLPDKKRIVVFRMPDPAVCQYGESHTVERDGTLRWEGQIIPCGELFPE